MPSSTLHSNRVPRLAALLLAVALGVLILAGLYSVCGNPEVRFLHHLWSVKSRWAQAMSTNATRVIFFGGSSCGTAVDPERMLAGHGVPAVNMGFGAALGPAVLSRAAMSLTRPGDTLVIALEPELLGASAEPMPLGAQFSVAVGHPDWFQSIPGTPPCRPAHAALHLRPGGWHVFTMIGKIVWGLPLYRYSPEEVHPGGWHEVRTRLPVTDGPPWPALSPDGRTLLRYLKRWADDQRVQIFYSLPVRFAEASSAPAARKASAQWLLTVIDHVPVLKDPALGVDTNRSDFADMHLHLNRAGAHDRTDQLARQLRSRSVWTAAELQAIVNQASP